MSANDVQINVLTIKLGTDVCVAQHRLQRPFTNYICI